MRKFDVIIIGAGQAGIPLAKKLALAGKKVAIIEKRWIGGSCINDGCTPTKTIIASARLAYLAHNSSIMGISIPKMEINFKRIIARKNKIVKQFKEGATKGLEKTKNLTILYGEASFASSTQVIVLSDSEKKLTLQASKIFINTGSSTAVPQIEGINKIDYLTSTSILDLTKPPKHLLIVGGGYIALEMGQMFRRFGSQVTIVEQKPRLLIKEDEDVSAAIEEIFKTENIKTHTLAEVIKFEKKNKSIRVNIKIGEKIKKISCSHVLIASGRKPQTKALNLELAGVKIDEYGFIKVDPYLRTNVSHIFALGDVKGGPSFTHIAYNDYVIVAHNMIQKEKINTNKRMIPYTVFTDPQLGRIGITEAQAIEKGINFKVVKIYNYQVARAIETGDTRGFMKAIVDLDTKQILGAAILSAEGGEIMSILQMAMLGNVTYEQIRYNIFAHPLYAESLNNLFMALDHQ